MKYLILFKTDLFKEGIRDHIISADRMEQTDLGITFYRKRFKTEELIAFYKLEHIIVAGEVVTFNLEKEGE